MSFFLHSMVDARSRHGRPLAALALVAGLLCAQRAEAGPPEVIAEIAVHPKDPQSIVLRYDQAFGGLLISNDGGKTFRIRPGYNIARSGVRQDASLAVTAEGVILVGGTDGLTSLDINGCNNNMVTGRSWSDPMTLHPTDPSIVYFGTSHASAGVRTGLWKRDAKGTVSPLGPDTSLNGDSSAVTVTGMRSVTVATASEQVRLVETATRITRSDAGQTSAAIVRYTDDCGVTWTEHVISMPVGKGTPRLLAVDPLDPQRVLIAISIYASPDPDDLILLSQDGGATFSSYISGLTAVGQSHVAVDGRVWIADLGDPGTPGPSGGLWYVKRLGETPEQLIDGIGILGVAEDPTSKKLWISEEYSLSLFDPATRTKCRAFDMNDTKGFVQCSNENLASNSLTKMQMCQGFCGALHFAVAPLCAVYNDEAALCGAPAAASDRRIDYPNPAGEAERCAGFPETTQPDVFDAGKPAAPIDAGTTPVPERDAEVIVPLDGGLDAGVVTPERKKDDGCALASGAHGASTLGLSFLVALLRRRRARRN